MLSDQIITRKPPASYNKQYIRNIFFLFFSRGGGGGALMLKQAALNKAILDYYI